MKRRDEKALGTASAFGGVLLHCAVWLPVKTDILLVPLSWRVLACILLPLLYGIGVWLYLPPGLVDHQNHILAGFSLLAGLQGVASCFAEENGSSVQLKIMCGVPYLLVWAILPFLPESRLLEVVSNQLFKGLVLAFVASGCALAPVLLGPASMGGWMFLWMGCCALALGYVLCLPARGENKTKEDGDEETTQPGEDYVLLVAEPL